MKEHARFRVMVVEEEGMEPEQWTSETYLTDWLPHYQAMLAHLREIYVDVWTEDAASSVGSGRVKGAKAWT